MNIIHFIHNYTNIFLSIYRMKYYYILVNNFLHDNIVTIYSFIPLHSI